MSLSMTYNTNLFLFTVNFSISLYFFFAFVRCLLCNFFSLFLHSVLSVLMCGMLLPSIWLFTVFCSLSSFFFVHCYNYTHFDYVFVYYSIIYFFLQWIVVAVNFVVFLLSKSFGVIIKLTVLQNSSYFEYE